MKVETYLYKNGKIEKSNTGQLVNPNGCQLVLGFGGKQELSSNNYYELLRGVFPEANIALCSSSGEIYGTEVTDEMLSVTAIEFEKTTIETTSINISSFKSSYEAGVALINQLPQEDLRYVLVLSDGSIVNGSELVRGVESIVQHKVPVTGGLAGDGTAFLSTLVGLNSNPKNGTIIGVGFYGGHIKIGHGSMGGWEMFGLEKKVTKSKANELFEIDNMNALDIYKQYLGNYVNELPGSALLFPLSIKLNDNDEPIVRTILSINNESKSMVFAGDVPEGSKVRFMKANFDKLIDAASDATVRTLSQLNQTKPKLALLISCVGRKIILNKRIDEEVEAVANVFGDEVVTTGFYSYGEISPMNPQSKCELHNQTMTITSFDEV